MTPAEKQSIKHMMDPFAPDGDSYALCLGGPLEGKYIAVQNSGEYIWETETGSLVRYVFYTHCQHYFASTVGNLDSHDLVAALARTVVNLRKDRDNIVQALNGVLEGRR